MNMFLEQFAGVQFMLLIGVLGMSYAYGYSESQVQRNWMIFALGLVTWALAMAKNIGAGSP